MAWALLAARLGTFTPFAGIHWERPVSRIVDDGMQDVQNAETDVAGHPPIPVMLNPRLMAPRMEKVTMRPEVLCGTLAAFGLVERGLQRVALRNGSWECAPLLVNVRPLPSDGEATSIFTLVRGQGSLDPPRIRMKLNELDPATVEDARRIAMGALRSAVRGYDRELGHAHVAALSDMREIDIVENGIRLKIDAEMDDARRYNILLEFVSDSS